MKFKRKNRLVQVREPNGRPSRSTEEREYAPVRVRRLLDAAMCGMADAEWGSAIGRLYAAGKLSSPMYAAGKRWAERVMTYHTAINAPASSPKAVVMESMGGTPADPDSPEGQKRTEREVKAIEEFQMAHAALVGAGKLSESIVRAACEQDQSPEGHEQLEALKRGLSWLAEYWQLTNHGKS